MDETQTQSRRDRRVSMLRRSFVMHDLAACFA
jgi:hypothetical protein